MRFYHETKRSGLSRESSVPFARAAAFFFGFLKMIIKSKKQKNNIFEGKTNFFKKMKRLISMGRTTGNDVKHGQLLGTLPLAR